MKYFDSVEDGVVVVSLGQGDLLLESLREVAKAADIHTGVITSGLGSFSRARIQGIAGKVDLQERVEVVDFCGIIADYEPHVHISLIDSNGKYHGGHLVEGCAIYTIGELAIQRLVGLKLTRRVRDGSPFALLDEQTALR